MAEDEEDEGKSQFEGYMEALEEWREYQEEILELERRKVEALEKIADSMTDPEWDRELKKPEKIGRKE